MHIGITYSEDSEDGEMLTAYVDSDHAGDLDTGYSTTGVVPYFAGGPVDWMSTKQTVVAISTVEAEYVTMSKACLMVTHFASTVEIATTVKACLMVTHFASTVEIATTVCFVDIQSTGPQTPR